MESNKIGYWLQIVANVGLLIGLVLVGVQINQNSELLKSQLLFEESRTWIEGERALLGENAAAVWAKSMQDPSALTLTEQRIIEVYLYNAVESWRATQLLAQQGLLDDEWRGRVLEETTYFFGNPYGRAWWANYRDSDWLSPDLVELIDERLLERPNWTMEYHDSILNDAIREFEQALLENGKPKEL